MVSKEELSFFKEKRKIEDILEEFGNKTGSLILKDLLEEDFLVSKDKYFYLSKRGNIQLDKLLHKKEVEKKGRLRIFLSYSSKDYETAKQIKLFLEDFGFEVFLAHTSIEPSKEWEEEIYHNLEECDLFIPILTDNFKESKWTDQECGIAYALKKKFLPLILDIVPYGFLGKFQGLRVDKGLFNWKKKDSRAKIIFSIKELYPREVRRNLIDSIDKTTSWIIGSTRFNILKSFNEPYTTEEINKIIEMSTYNNQVYDADGVKSYLRKLLLEYDSQIKSKIKEDFVKIVLKGK